MFGPPGPRTLTVRRVDVARDTESSLFPKTETPMVLKYKLAISIGSENTISWNAGTKTFTITLVQNDDMLENLRLLLLGNEDAVCELGLSASHHTGAHNYRQLLSNLNLLGHEYDLSVPRDALPVTITDGRLHNLEPGRVVSGEISFTGASFDLMNFNDGGGNRVPVTLYVSQDANDIWSVKMIKTADIGAVTDFHYILGTIAANSLTLVRPVDARGFDVFNYNLLGLTPAPMAVQVPVVNLDGAGNNARADLSGAAGVADIFTIDADAGKQAGADTITGFEATRDKLQIGNGTGAHMVHVRIAGDDTVIYSANGRADARTGADANILAVLTGATVTKAQLDAGLFEGTGRVTIGSITQVHDGASDNARADLSGAADVADIFTIDADAGTAAGADTIAGFEAQDSIRLGDDDGTGTATVTFEYDGINTLLYNTDTTGDDAAAKAGKVLAVLTGYDLSADGNALQATDVIGAGTVINLHGSGAADNGRQTMQGAATTKDVFNVDGTAGDRASADIIKAFEDGTDIVKVAGDIDIFWHVETVNAGQPNEAKNTIFRSTNSDSGDNIIAIIEGFDADAAGVTFDDSDFVGNGAIQEIT